jgi:hypothetical protein
LAKEASITSANMDEAGITSQGDVKNAARTSVQAKWQRQCDLPETGRRLYQFKPQVLEKVLIDYPNPRLYSEIARLRYGYIGLRKYLYQIGKADSALCDHCGTLSNTLQ